MLRKMSKPDRKIIVDFDFTSPRANLEKKSQAKKILHSSIKVECRSHDPFYSDGKHQLSKLLSASDR